MKAREELAEGLHLIYFEQLKIENQSLNEKIEERNEELLKLKKKITTTVQVTCDCQYARWNMSLSMCIWQQLLMLSFFSHLKNPRDMFCMHTVTQNIDTCFSVQYDADPDAHAGETSVRDA